MRLKKAFLNRDFLDINSVNANNLYFDETRDIKSEINSLSGDNLTIDVVNGIFLSGCLDSNKNGLYLYAGIISSKPYYTLGNYRIIWSNSNYRWEIQQITPNVLEFHGTSIENLSQPFYDPTWVADNGSGTPSFLLSDKLIKNKNIDYIIDDDNESIDGSNTPMVDPHRELITRAFAESIVQNANHWTKNGSELIPQDANVNVLTLDRNHNAYTQVMVRNENSTGNGAGALIEIKGSGANYTNNAYFGIYSPNFWLSQLAGNSVLMTDRKLVIGTVDVNESIEFLVGNSYSNPIVVGHLNQDGLHLDTLQTTTVHPASYYNVFVDATTGLLYGSNTGATGNTPNIETFTITSTIIANLYIDLSETPSSDNHNSVNLNGSILFEGSGEDYEISSNRVSFDSSVNLTLGDKVQIKYKY